MDKLLPEEKWVFDYKGGDWIFRKGDLELRHTSKLCLLERVAAYLNSIPVTRSPMQGGEINLYAKIGEINEAFCGEEHYPQAGSYHDGIALGINYAVTYLANRLKQGDAQGDGAE